MGQQTLNKTLLDQISNGQIEWAPLDNEYDVVQIGFDKESSRSYPVLNGKDNWKNELHKQFPGEKTAIDQFFHPGVSPIVHLCRNHIVSSGIFG